MNIAWDKQKQKKYNYRHWGSRAKQTVYSNGKKWYVQGYDAEGNLVKVELTKKASDSLIEALWQLRSVR